MRYGEIVVSDTEDNLMDFSVEITKQLIRGGETFQSELLGKWQTTGHVTPDSTVLAESDGAASFFSAQKVYQVAIVVVRVLMEKISPLLHASWWRL